MFFISPLAILKKRTIITMHEFEIEAKYFEKPE